MEDRKLKEIEHSRQRRQILQGFERVADTHSSDSSTRLDHLILDKDNFEKHFSNMKYYSITKSSERDKHMWLAERCKANTKVLDFACGNGENGLFAAQCGSTVSGIDISPEGISNCINNAKDLGLDTKATFSVMDGEKMSFPDSTFDIGIEYGALHHVDLPIALAELARVLKPGAQMLCVEAMRHNPFIHAYRKRTPHLRTEWEVEHILGVESFEIMRHYFGKVSVRFYHLTSLLLVPFRKTFLFPLLLPIFDFVDKVILRTQFIGKYGWIMLIELSDPIK